MSESPIACVMGAILPADRPRYDALTRKLFAAATGRRETADGWAFTLDPNRVSLAEVGEWIAFEQRCCPFFDFRLELAREGGAVTLMLGGREGVKEFIVAEFAAAF